MAIKVFGAAGDAVNPITSVPQGIGNQLIGVQEAPAGVVFDPTTDMRTERLIQARSSSAAQDPTGVGTANAIQLTFGAPQGTALDPLQLLADGTLQCNIAGTYFLEFDMQVGRLGSSGTSIILFQIRLNGAKAAETRIFKLNNTNTNFAYQNSAWVNLTAGDLVTWQIMRDASGDNSGGAIGFNPTVEGGNEWADSPATTLRMSRWIPTP